MSKAGALQRKILNASEGGILCLLHTRKFPQPAGLSRTLPNWPQLFSTGGHGIFFKMEHFLMMMWQRSATESSDSLAVSSLMQLRL